jgi:hypothetical protein
MGYHKIYYLDSKCVYIPTATLLLFRNTSKIFWHVTEVCRESDAGVLQTDSIYIVSSPAQSVTDSVGLEGEV